MNATKHYPWSRYWTGSGTHFWLDADGYLSLPDAGRASLYRPEELPRPLEGLEGVPCLVLLGEPGMGKTTAMEAYEGDLRRRGERVLSAPLGSLTADDGLQRRVFSHVEFARWQEGEERLWVLLDSLDEGLVVEPGVADAICDRLGDFDEATRQRIRVRVTCRDGDVPARFTADLASLFGDKGRRTLELLPLRRDDVRSAAACEGHSVEEFASALDSSGAHAFACRPITLRFLLDGFARDGRIESDPRRLYEGACLELAAEWDEDRRTHRQAPLDKEQRLEVSARIAACLSLGAYGAVWLSDTTSGIAENDIGYTSIAWGEEKAQGKRVEVTHLVVEEVLGTGLFRRIGEHRYVFAHQTYQEYLAARYVASHLTETQAREILTADVPGGRRVAPRARSVTAWLARMDGAWWEWLLQHDPTALLEQDVTLSGSAHAEKLADRYLSMAEESGPIPGLFWPSFRRLAHPGLASQLRLIPRDGSRSRHARFLAVGVAGWAREAGVAPDLVDLALDESEERSLRVEAAGALGRIGDDDALLRLRPLLQAQFQGDARDALRIAALCAIGPDRLRPEEILGALATDAVDLHQRRMAPIGLTSFIRQCREQLASIPYLRAALRWLADLPPHGHVAYDEFRELAKAVLVEAWRRRAEPGVLAQLAEVLAARVEDRHWLEPGGATEAAEWLDDEADRRALAELVVHHLDPSAMGASAWQLTGPSWLIRTGDLEWCLGHAQQASDDAIRRLWAALAGYVWDRGDRRESEVAYAAAEQNEVIARALGQFSVNLSSAYAQTMCQQSRHGPGPPTDRPEVDEAIGEAVSVLLGESPEGERWARFCACACAGDHPYPLAAAGGIRTRAVWGRLPPEATSAAQMAALAYVWQTDPKTETWLGQSRRPWEPVLGYLALLLLAGAENGLQPELSHEQWAKWTPAIVDTQGAGGTDEAHRTLLARARDRAPSAFVDALQRTLSGGSVAIAEHLDPVWDEEIEAAALAAASEPALPAEKFGGLLECLVRNGSVDGIGLAQAAFVRGGVLPDEAVRERAEVAGAVLVARRPETTWPQIVELVEKAPEFAQAVLGRVEYYAGRTLEGVAADLSTSGAARVYVAMAPLVPPDADRCGEGFRPVGRAEQIRSAMLKRIRSDAPHEEIDALEWIRDHLPEERDGVAYELELSRRRLAGRQCQRLTPDHLRRLVEDGGRRFVSTEEQLLRVVHESLQQFETDLRTPPAPAARVLWNEGKKRCAPKGEDAVADELCRHLKRDLERRGVIVNLEVTVLRPPGASLGPRTDIHVQAPGEQTTLTVVIEVKCPWNYRLRQAMRTQLQAKYLQPGTSAHGIYAVPWFLCTQWDPSDPHLCRARDPKRGGTDMLKLQAYLEEQAERLGTEHGTQIVAWVFNAGFPSGPGKADAVDATE